MKTSTHEGYNRADPDKLRANVPEDMRTLQVWLLWRQGKSKNASEKPQKIPVYANGRARRGPLDSSQDRSQLVTFEEVIALYERDRQPWMGLGVALGPTDPIGVLSGIDLDDCIVEGAFTNHAKQIIATAGGSYCEVSPGAYGIKIFGRDEIGTDQRNRIGAGRSEKLEIYSGSRFFTVTGQRHGSGNHLASLRTAADRARELFPSEPECDSASDEMSQFDCARAAALLAPHWSDGERHSLALTVAGALHRARVDVERILELIESVLTLTRDEEPDERRKCVATAIKQVDSGGRMYGIPSLRRRLGADTEEFLAACGIPDRNGPLRLEDFWAYLPDHKYLHTLTREMWPAPSVDSQIAPRGKRRASAILDRERAVHQMTWAPGYPQIIHDKVVTPGGWTETIGANVFNLYRPPTIELGDPRGASRWLRAISLVWPRYARRHIISWCAHRVQRPGEKINHALILGGDQGVGKDTLLEPLKRAVGHANFTEVNPSQLLGRFNGFVKSVVLRVNEARDLGDINRYELYEHSKTLTAAPPDVLRCDEKNLREHSVMNVVGVIFTTNHLEDGIYLPRDDRRHFVAWSERKQEEFQDGGRWAGYWQQLWDWYEEQGGYAHVAAFLQTWDLTGWDPKASPPKTPAFWTIVDANRAPEDSEFADVLDRLENPAAITLDQLRGAAYRLQTSTEEQPAVLQLLNDQRRRRQIPHRLKTAGYTPVRNPSAPKEGDWKVQVNDQSKRVVIYAKVTLSERERLMAAERLSLESIRTAF